MPVSTTFAPSSSFLLEVLQQGCLYTDEQQWVAVGVAPKSHQQDIECVLSHGDVQKSARSAGSVYMCFLFAAFSSAVSNTPFHPAQLLKHVASGHPDVHLFFIACLEGEKNRKRKKKIYHVLKVRCNNLMLTSCLLIKWSVICYLLCNHVKWIRIMRLVCQIKNTCRK